MYRYRYTVFGDYYLIFKNRLLLKTTTKSRCRMLRCDFYVGPFEIEFLILISDGDTPPDTISGSWAALTAYTEGVTRVF